MASDQGLGIADIVVFCVLTAAGYFVGLYFSFKGRRRQAASCDGGTSSAVLEAFLGGRTLPAAALAVSVLASVATAVSVVSFVGHYYAFGFNLAWGGWLVFHWRSSLFRSSSFPCSTICESHPCSR
ncbi:hypothetical protein MTO96_005986 [Rhipicephalus appendiculatus]